MESKQNMANGSYSACRRHHEQILVYTAEKNVGTFFVLVKYIHFSIWQFPKSWPCPRTQCSFSEDSIWPRREAKDPEYKKQNKKQRNRSTKPCISQTINQNVRLNNASPWETTRQLQEDTAWLWPTENCLHPKPFRVRI